MSALSAPMVGSVAAERADRLPWSELDGAVAYPAGPTSLLCALDDLSPDGALALRRAELLARQFGARLTVLHVVEAEHPAAREAETADEARMRLEVWLESLTPLAGGAPELVVRTGDSCRTIAAVSRERDSDLIVAGPGMSRKPPLTPGSAARLLRSAGRPVLVVNREPRGPYQRILLAADLSEASARMLVTVNALGLLQEASASLVHAFEVPYKGMLTRVGIDDERILEYSGGWLVQRIRELNAHVEAAGVDTWSVRMLLEDAQPLRAIRRAVRRTRPDLLAIGTRAHTGLRRVLLGSVAEEVLRSSPCDVLVVPPPLAH